MNRTGARQACLVVAITAVTIFLGGCASMEKNAALEQAKDNYAQARMDPTITRNVEAADYMAQAETALEKSRHKYSLKNTFGEDIDSAEIDHWAYVAEKNVEMARLAAESAATEEELASLQTQLDRALVENRAREEQMRRAEIEAARIAAEQAEAERLAQAQRDAEIAAALEQAELAGAEVERSGDEVKVTFRDVTFEVNRTDLNEEFKNELKRLADALNNAYPDVKLVVRGHTDATGPDSYNKALSEKRAIAVKTFLIDQGISDSRITSVGLGEANPVADNESQEGRARNRRVEVVVSGEGE
jgi:outer membrane protein OmpA-like peptidoglycan-associated protein